jgi:hypothetical protein
MRLARWIVVGIEVDASVGLVASGMAWPCSRSRRRRRVSTVRGNDFNAFAVHR